MSWNVSFGISGRACCRICEKVITKEQLQVNFSHDGGVHTVEQSVHLDCLAKNGCSVVAKREKSSNPFDFYTGKDYSQSNKECTRGLKALWDEFVDNWLSLRKSYQIIGSTDTASKEAQAHWITKKLEDGELS